MFLYHCHVDTFYIIQLFSYIIISSYNEVKSSKTFGQHSVISVKIDWCMNRLLDTYFLYTMKNVDEW